MGEMSILDSDTPSRMELLLMMTHAFRCVSIDMYVIEDPVFIMNEVCTPQTHDTNQSTAI